MPITMALILTFTYQTAVTPEVKEARRLAKEAERYADRSPKAKKMYMLRGGKWAVMRKADDHLQDEMWRDDVSLVAFTWAKGGKTLFVSYTGGSPSGDWTSSRMSTYRTNGTLAHSSYRFAAFMFGGRVMEQEAVFNAKGKQIFAVTKVTDLDGKKRIGGEEAKQVIANRPEIKDYLRASLLPFPR